MTLPRLNRKLTLEAQVRLPDQAGGYATDWQGLGLLWAEIQPGTGSERGMQAVPVSRTPMRIVVRAAPPGSDARPVAGQRFRDGSRYYRIIAVTEQDTGGRYLLCRTQEEASS